MFIVINNDSKPVAVNLNQVKEFHGVSKLNAESIRFVMTDKVYRDMNYPFKEDDKKSYLSAVKERDGMFNHILALMRAKNLLL